MTDSLQVGSSDSVNVGTESSAIAPSSSPQTTEERLIPQSEVDKIAGSARKEGYEKGQKTAQSVSNQPASQSMGGMSQLSDDELNRRIEEAATRKVAEVESKRERDAKALQAAESQKEFEGECEKTATEFIQKLRDPTNIERYPDFEQTMSSLDFRAPAVIALVPFANQFENTADMMYELAKNESKILTLVNGLEKLGEGYLQKELQKLSQSIQGNKSAKQTSSAREPLRQIKSSTVGMDNGVTTVSDERRNPLLRG